MLTDLGEQVYGGQEKVHPASDAVKISRG